MTPKILVTIPAFNEQDSIGKVLADIPEGLIQEVVVVNNGSTDNTKTEAKAHGAAVIDEPIRGYGRACLKGIEYAKGLSDEPDIIVFLDGDYSDFPGEMTELVAPIIKRGYDMVIGSRTLGKADPGALLPQARFGNALATFLIRILYGMKFTDLGPFRAIKFERLVELEMADKSFGWTVEMQVKAAKKGYKCTEVPVSYRKRIGVSKITGTLSGSFKAGYMILWTIFKLL